jgi:hypothetical protein
LAIFFDRIGRCVAPTEQRNGAVSTQFWILIFRRDRWQIMSESVPELK